jgi:hypothetical protein
MTRSTLTMIAVLLAGPASAQIVIDASDYRAGTNISNVIPGVTMSYASIPPGTNAVFTYSTLAAIPYTPGPLTIQSGTLGSATFNTLGGDTGGLDGVGPGGLLLQFANPVDAFSFVSQDFDGDPTIATIFDSSGNQIVTGNTEELDGGCMLNPAGFCEYHNTGGAIQSSTPISSILIGGLDEEAFILRIDAQPVSVVAPEIDSSSAASALTLLLGSLIVLGSKRPKLATDGAVSR